MLASGSRDRLIHVFDVRNECQHVAVIDDHPSSIQSLLFAQSPTGPLMLSAGADKSIVFREYTEEVGTVARNYVSKLFRERRRMTR